MLQCTRYIVFQRKNAKIGMVRKNPFSTKFWTSGIIPFQFSESSENISTLMERMRRQPICQIVGPHGSGKSTLLLELLRQHEQNGEKVCLLFFNDQHRRIPGDVAFQDSPLFFVDGFEQLSPADRLRLLFRAKHLVLTAHRPVWFVPVLYRTNPQFLIFAQIVQHLVSQPHDESVLRTVYERSGGNFRTAFFELYDQWEVQ